MTDRLVKMHRNPLTGWLARSLGLPNPTPLNRDWDGYSQVELKGRSALVRSAPGSVLSAELQEILKSSGSSIADGDATALDIVVLDMTGITSLEGLHFLYDAMHPLVKRVTSNGRIVILSSDAKAQTVETQTIQKAIEGFMRSLAKETGRRAITVNLVKLANTNSDSSQLVGALRFFGSQRCAYVSGQVVQLSEYASEPQEMPLNQVLAGKTALVTGAARGIGKATAERLAQEGAQVICLDVPQASEELKKVAHRLGGLAYSLNITEEGAQETLTKFIAERCGGLDIVVHNAGITKDKTLAKMSKSAWDAVMNVNLMAITKINEALLTAELLRDHGRIICLSSISGVAGNFGQTNYAMTKSALIGYTAALADDLADKSITVNAVAPGFIATPMTEKMPFMTREIGQRLNSLSQPGVPRDVAELVCFFASPSAFSVSGNTIRVCGQGMIGA